MSHTLPETSLPLQLRDVCVKKGNFTLSSGLRASEYVNVNLLLSHALRYRVLEEFQRLTLQPVDHVIGVPTSGVPWASALAFNTRTSFLRLRPQTKDHGTRVPLEGKYEKGDTVLLVEDVITTGASTKKTIQKLEKLGLRVVQVLCVCDRSSSPVDFGIPYASLMKVPITPISIVDELKRLGGERGRIVLSADVPTFQELETLIHKVGDKVAVIKVHLDILQGWTAEGMKALSSKYGFLWMADRKLVDIASIARKQTPEWVHLVTVVPFSGPHLIKALGGRAVVVTDMSSDGSHRSPGWDSYIDNLLTSESVAGVVSQTPHPHLLTFTPGVRRKQGGDGMGQRYRRPQDVKSDFLIVGRGILNAEDPADELEKYQLYSKL